MRLRILIALALVGALAGCQESGFDESKETQRPLKVQDAMNPLNGTKVPGQAERPATLTADTLGDTLALGVTPVVASDVPDYMRADARGVRVVKDTDLSGIRRGDSRRDPRDQGEAGRRVHRPVEDRPDDPRPRATTGS